MLKLITLALLAVIAASAQDARQPQSSAPPPGARYELVPCWFTFRLDRFTGHVDRWRETREGVSSWETLEVPGLPVADGLPRFQLSCENASVFGIFLLDATTGQTWKWAADQSGRGDFAWRQILKP
ncbi:MAG: hypothetical protein RL328_2020 [Acidobacteriota bacterium]|jgi:hypothetical protein